MKKHHLLLTKLTMLLVALTMSMSLMAQMTLEYNLDLSSGTTITLPLYGTVNVTVDWGDGNSEPFTTTGNKNHTYTTGGVYTVSISGNLTQFGSGAAYNNADKLIKVTSFGNIGLTSLSGAFYGTSNLEEVSAALPSTITNMSYTFHGTGKVTITGLDSWDVSNVTYMYSMFKNAYSFNQNISSWNLGNVISTAFMFFSNYNFNQDIDGWDVSNVTDMSGMFRNAYSFNKPINSWDVSSVTDMEQMFLNAESFNQPLSNWDVSSVTDMAFMYSEADVFNQNIGGWDVSSVTNMEYMFRSAITFNQDINSWDVSNVTNMNGMFYGVDAFNKPINSWDVSNVTRMNWMFSYADVFNQQLNSWNVSSVTSMGFMFYAALAFNQPLNSWNVSSVTNMSNMFVCVSNLNQPLDSWDVSNVTNMDWMFRDASAFNQDISSWNVSNVTTMQYMFSSVTLSTANYNSLLIAWAALDLHNGVSFHGGNSKYSAGAAAAARAAIIADDSWTITDGGMESSIVWEGTSDNEWNLSSCWEGGVIPSITDNVVIPVSPNNPVIIPASSGSCNNLIIDNGASLRLHSDGTSGTASLLTNGTITNNGTINMERYITSSKWHLISSPISDATANTFFGEYLQYYDGTWNDITNAATALTPVQGYSLWDAVKASTYTFTGNLNNGDQSISITSANDGWNLLGNPYPSPIDWSMLDDTYGAVYYWDSENSVYVSWNNGSGTGVQYVPSMQGFWIKTTSNGTFNVSNAERTHSGNTVYYKNLKLPQNYVELQVNGNEYYDRLCVNLNEETSSNFDFQYDAYKLLSPEEAVPQLYSFAGEDMLSIDVRPPQEVIQLGFQCGESGNYSLKLNELTDITSVVLEDTKTGKMHNLQNKEYDFEYLTTDDEQRFKLHLQVTWINDTPEDSFTIYADNKTIYLKSEEVIHEGTIKVLDMMGRTMIEQKVSNSSFVKIPANYKAGIYIVMLKNESDVISKKVFIN